MALLLLGNINGNLGELFPDYNFQGSAILPHDKFAVKTNY